MLRSVKLYLIGLFTPPVFLCFLTFCVLSFLTRQEFLPSAHPILRSAVENKEERHSLFPTALADVQNPFITQQSAITGKVVRFVKENPGANEVALGFDPPQPTSNTVIRDSDSQQYRTLSAIEDRLIELAREHPNITVTIGQGVTKFGRLVRGLIVSNRNTVRDDGTPKPRVVLIGGIHAREWISPEVVLRIAERLLEKYGSDDYVTFLVNNCEVVIIPVLNPDGFVYTQSEPSRFLVFDPIPPGGTKARDGRLRRKNLQDATDQSFATQNEVTVSTIYNNNPFITQTLGLTEKVNEALLGVDLNRNHEVGYGNLVGDPRNSDDPRDLVFRGGAGNDITGYLLGKAEPETRAFRELALGALDFFASRVRGYIDYHSFEQTIIVPLIKVENVSDTARNAVAQQLAAQIKQYIEIGNADARNYTVRSSDATSATGATDEFIANKGVKPPSFTIELPPRASDLNNRPIDDDDIRVQSGFILPNSIVPAIAAEQIYGANTLIDFAIGPAHVYSVTLWRDGNNDGLIQSTEIYYNAFWTLGREGTRTLNTTVNNWVTAGKVYFLITFNEPMKLPNTHGDPVERDLTTVARDPEVKFKQRDRSAAPEHDVTKARGWLKSRQSVQGSVITPGFKVYKFDTWEGVFNIPQGESGNYDGLNIELRIKAKDLLQNELDGKPDTPVDFNKQWVKFEDGDQPSNENSGGVDKNYVFKIDTQPPRRR